ncbi:efflux RND transporter periplasmic adaptor subunit [Aneurinibacillus sp. Ricciae_BoGa-3]|uniref:efflux RND transporter periplasmic adaptor subunit n=1 Tax=Aneurinibacillus sp. Ricciae_BoGa-3 TaxID=3022697 RepID=UPI002341AE57|nr:efflux RND transporter periplasmic adaptor subunit [Aneurinibacillus sp. Ricciae_BoGa-3]WCK55302.1 efflux RND transporter periplasmic adaptor subunit [Aneurinibacillus sp. Ricciae_BoGa-3]
MRRLRYFLLFIPILTLSSSLMAGCSQQTMALNKKTSQSTPVKVITVRQQNIADTITLNGQCTPALLTKVVSKQTGKVSGVFVQPGQAVTAGQTLIQLDTSDLQIQLQQQQAALQVAQAQADKVASDAQRSYTQATNAWGKEKSTALSTLNQEQANLEDAKMKLQREQSLYANGAAPEQDVNSAELAYKNEQTKYQAAEKQYQLALADSTTLDNNSTKLAQAQVAQSQAAMASTRHSIDEMTITAPVSGVIVSRDVEIGGVVGAQNSAVTIAQLDPIKIMVNVPETYIDKVPVHTALNVSMPVLKGAVYKAVVSRVNPVEDSTTKTYAIEVDVPNPDGRIKPGMIAQASIGGINEHRGLVIPANALVQTPDGPKVFTVEGNVAHQHLVQIGTIKKDTVEVKAGLKAGDVLVTEGQEFLSEGKSVNTGTGNGNQQGAATHHRKKAGGNNETS